MVAMIRVVLWDWRGRGDDDAGKGAGDRGWESAFGGEPVFIALFHPRPPAMWGRGIESLEVRGIRVIFMTMC